MLLDVRVAVFAFLFVCLFCLWFGVFVFFWGVGVERAEDDVVTLFPLVS